MEKIDQYIKMCEKAIEIQESYRSRIPSGDDMFRGKIYHGIELFGHLTPTNVPVTDNYIWLPRQEQLQEMIFEKTAVSLACRFKDFIVRPLFDKTAPYKFTPDYSMEQLWLAYVMYTKFGKVWNQDKSGWSSLEKCDVCGTVTHIGKRHIYLQYNEWQHSFGQSFQRCFKKHFGYDLNKERFEESSKIFFLKERNLKHKKVE